MCACNPKFTFYILLTAISYTNNDGVEFKYSLGTDKLNFEQSRRRCLNKDGGNLVSINDEEEQEFLASIIASEPGNYWLGLESKNGIFERIDG